MQQSKLSFFGVAKGATAGVEKKREAPVVEAETSPKKAVTGADVAGSSAPPFPSKAVTSPKKEAGTEKKKEELAPKKGVSPDKDAAGKKRERDDEVVLVGEEGDDAVEIAAIIGSDDEEEDVSEEKEGEEGEKEPAKKATMAKKKTTVTAPSAVPKDNYDPVKDACWKKGQPVPYRALADTLALIEETSSRLHIIQHLANFFRSIICLSPSELLTAIYLSTNQLGPAFEGVELGIGESIIMKAIGETCGKTMPVLKQMYKDLGDLGTMAMESRATQKTLFTPQALTLQHVFKSFRSIAMMSGTKSGKEKSNTIKKLLVAAKGVETRYIVRSLQGKLRIGLAAKSVLVAMVHAIVLTPPDKSFPPRILNRAIEGPVRGAALKTLLEESVATVKEVYSEVPSYETMLPVLLNTETIGYGETIASLREQCSIKPGIPVHPMLAQPTRGITEVLDRFSETGFTCEYKYDGERAQVHLVKPGQMFVFSRNLEDNTGKYPDIVRDIPNALKDPAGITSFIVDCEAVAWDKAHQKRRPFQVLSTRRKKNVEATDVEVAVMIYAFDILFLNGKSLLKLNLQERRALLRDTFREVPDQFAFAEYRDCTTVEEVRDLLEKSIAEDCEGLMVKTLTYNSTYEPSKRSFNWLKVKKDYLEGMTDSLDLVPIGAWYGHGKRTGVYGGYLLACYNDEDEEYQSISVVGTGFSDAQLKEFTDLLARTVVEHKPKYVRVGEGKQAKPDVWMTPTVVWEIKAADLSISPVHTAAAGLVHESKGIALRFPRIVRVRDDKKPEDATNSTQVAQLYSNQGSSKGTIGYGIENEQTRSLKQYKADTLAK